MRTLVTLVAVCAALLTVPLAAPAQAAAEYTRIKSAVVDKCVGINNNGYGGNIQMMPCAGKSWEYWYIDTFANSRVRLRSASARAWNKCVDASRGNKAQLIIVGCDGSARQVFIRTFISPGANGYRLESEFIRGLCVDLKGGSGGSDVVQLYPCHTGLNQVWWPGS